MSKFPIKRISRAYFSEGTRFKRVMQLHCGLKKGLKLVVLWVDDKIKTSEDHTFETPFRPAVQIHDFHVSTKYIFNNYSSRPLTHEAEGRIGY